MIALTLLGVAGLFVVWRLRRRAAKRALVAGLVAERPAFQVAPPPGRLGSMKDSAL